MQDDSVRRGGLTHLLRAQARHLELAVLARLEAHHLGRRARRRARSPAASGRRTAFLDAPRTNSSTSTSAISFPAPDHDQGAPRSTPSRTHHVRGDGEHRAWPSAANSFNMFRIHWMPSGSSPLAYQSSIRIFGIGEERRCESPSRWPILSENFPTTRFRATSWRPTRSITSDTRSFGTPWVCASASRW